MKWLKRVAALLLLLILGGVAAEKFAESRVPTAPGRLVDLGGRKLHLRCQGAGTPTVILSASGLSSTLEWDALLPKIPRRVCAYDRAGMGWSDPAPRQTAGEVVADLHTALQTAGERAPFILVGHSAGGVVVRAYQKRHPDEVSGLILVDTATRYVFDRWSEIPDRWVTSLGRARWFASLGLMRLFDPFHIDGVSAALTYRPRTFAAAGALIEALREEFPSLPLPPAVPTVVLTHAHGGDWAGPGIIDPADEEAVERDWQLGQKELGGTLLRAQHAGHFIPTEEPELLLRALDLLIHQLSSREPPAPHR
jgi:pimeloyl-ACP methyl ester carboxylesterase